MKHTILSTLLCATLAAPAFASSTGLSDSSAVFETSKASTLEFAVLSPEEMKSTEGAWGAWGPWGAIGGAAIGGISNIGYQLGSTNDWNWGQLGYSMGAGALTGFTGGPMAWYLVPRIAFLGGFGAGQMNW